MRRFTLSLALAVVITSALFAPNTTAYAWGRSGGSSPTIICSLLQRAISAAEAFGAEELAAYLTEQYVAKGCGS